MSMEHSSAVFTLRDWTITVHGMGSVPRAEDWIAGPRHRLDISFSARGEAPVLGPPHTVSLASLFPQIWYAAAR